MFEDVRVLRVVRSSDFKVEVNIALVCAKCNGSR